MLAGPAFAVKGAPHLAVDNRDRLSNTRIIPRVLAALVWGMLAAASLVIGAFLGLARNWKPGSIGAVLAFGAGALISSVAFELSEEGIEVGGLVAVAVGLGVGAVVFPRGPGRDPDGRPFRWRIGRFAARYRCLARRYP